LSGGGSYGSFLIQTASCR